MDGNDHERTTNRGAGFLYISKQLNSIQKSPWLLLLAVNRDVILLPGL